MYHNTMNYLQQLQQYIQHQDQRILQLNELLRELKDDVDQIKNQPYTNIERNELIRELKEDVDQIKNQPYTNIEKIEYKFDQLKIEQLDGTLNIGLNPTNPEQIENFEVQQKGMNINGVQQQMNEQLLRQCSEEINQFLNTDCISFIERAEQQYDLRLDDPHRRHIIEDIRKQIESRIQYYINQQPLSEQDSLLDKKQEILIQVKKDVENSINNFLNHLPKQS